MAAPALENGALGPPDLSGGSAACPRRSYGIPRLFKDPDLCGQQMRWCDVGSAGARLGRDPVQRQDQPAGWSWPHEHRRLTLNGHAVPLRVHNEGWDH